MLRPNNARKMIATYSCGMYPYCESSTGVASRESTEKEELVRIKGWCFGLCYLPKELMIGEERGWGSRRQVRYTAR